jgi:hypothetical protein
MKRREKKDKKCQKNLPPHPSVHFWKVEVTDEKKNQASKNCPPYSLQERERECNTRLKKGYHVVKKKIKPRETDRNSFSQEAFKGKREWNLLGRIYRTQLEDTLLQQGIYHSCKRDEPR